MLMTTYQGTETYLIECSRENSVINRIDDENTNGAWSNETEFNLKTGDRISVEMVSANIQGSGTGAPTIEFSGQNVVVNGEQKQYCDTKVLLEVFFYMNNNNTYSVGLPLIHPFGGINGTADLSSNRNIHMPVNLCPRLPVNQVTNQPNNFRELNEKVGYISQYAKVNEIELFHGIVGDAYGIHQYKYAPPNDPSANWYPDCSANVIVEGIRVLHEVGVGPATLATTFSSALEGQAGDLSQNNFHVGNHVYVDNNETITDASYRCWWLGQIKSLESYLVNGIEGLQIMFEPTTIVNTFDASENAQVASYVGTVYEWTPSTTPPWPYPTYLPNFNLKAGSSQEGLINYDNLNWNNTNKSDDYKLGNNGLFIYSKNIKKPQTNQSSEFNVFPHTEFEPAVDVCGNSFTSSAGEFGDKETGAQFGYRNANIQQENNNQPYIFMRNDHFGVGRMGKNGETYPLAEPMSAFIYISIEELLQDVNSLSAVINEKLNETLMGIGTTTQQTNQLLLNSLEIPEDMKQASNITPFYNRVGFYDRNVTDNSQNILMKQVANTQFRNIVTDIVPIKNGGAVKINPANLTPGLNYLALSFGKQYGGVPSMTPEGVNPTLDEQLWRAQHTYLRELLVSSQITGSETSTVTTTVNYPEVPAYTVITPQPDIYTPEVPEVPGVPESTIIYNSTADGSVSLVSDFDVANNVSPMALGNGAKLFTDDGGLNNDYSTSHSRHATFDAGSGNCIYINPRSFEFEHSSYSMYDRLGITCSDTVSGLSTSSGNLSSVDSTLSQYLYQSSNSSPSSFWGTSWVSGNGGYGTGGGWIFPNTSGTSDVKGNDNSGWINTWYKIDARYVRFWFISDGSATEPGWDILVARAVVTPAIPAIPAVPGFYTAQPDLVENFPAVPAYSVTTTGEEDTEISSLVSYNYNDWANPIYGNMATADLFKYQVADRFARLPLDKCNFLDYSSNKLEVRNVGKSIVLNNLLSYRKLDFKYPNLLNEYDNPNSPTSTPTSLVVNDLYENQLIYTNILFPSSVSQSWIDFAESLRKYETYYNLSKNAPNDFKTQQNDYKSWIWDADVGQTDDRSTGQLRQTPGQPENLPPFTSSGTNPLSFHQQNRPMIWDWLAKPPITATDVSSAMFNTALGVTTNDYSSIFDMDASRNLICPSTSHEIFAGISMTGNSDEQEKMRFMKDLGRLKLKSRFDKHWYANSRNYLNFNINSFSPVANPEVYDTGVKEAYQNNVDTSFAAKYDLPVVPYYYTKPDGDKVLLCAFQVGTKYVADSTKLSTINFGSMCWGNTIGVSSSFFDNHAIVPMNNDQVKRSTLLTQSTVGKPGYITICRQFSDNLDTRYYIDPSQNPYYFVPNQISWNADNSGNPQGYKVPPYQDVQNNNRMKFKCTWSGGPLGVPNVTAEWYQSNNLYEPVVQDYLPINVDALLPTFGGLQLGTSPVSFASPNGLGQAGLGTGSISDMKVYLYTDGMPVEYVNVTIEIYRNATITQNKNQVPLNLGIQHNNVNYVWVGSTKPTFQYNATKGRVEFVQLQEDNILNQLTSSSGGAISTNSTGQPAAIINSAIQDAVYSRNTTNEDYSNPAQTTPVKNQGIRAEISGIGIYNVYLCPENYNPPNDVNLSSYWSNKVVGNSKYQQTVLNRQKIIEGCIPASEKNWTGSLFSRLGFQSYRELLPVYGKQSNRFNPSTYNTTKPNLINRSTKPLILCNTVDNRINPALNTYYTAQIPAPHNIVNGLPLYSNGLLNNESTILDLEPQSLTATSPPILSTSPFLLIESDICQTNWRSGRTQQNVLFYLMKNYQASSFIYGYGSSYSHTVNQDRVLSLIHTAFRDPTTGRLQKCSSNSTIIYKIQRNVVILPPSTNVLNVPLNSSVPVSTTNRLLGEILEVEKGNKIHRSSNVKHYNTKNESQTNDTKQPGTKETNPETKQPETKETNETKETK